MGCCSIGCLGILGMVILVSVGGYFSLFHSSIPLRLIEAAIEEEGEVEIEGLTGTLSSGFSADEIRFKTVEDHWSKLTNIKFKYDSDNSFFGTERLVIQELSVDGGIIYADWDPEQNELDLDPDIGAELDEELEEFEQEFKEMEDEFREETGRSSGFRELRIDLVSVANLKVINPTTKLEVSVDELKFDGFCWKRGDLQNLGELLVRSSQVDLVTVPSVEYAGSKNARRFEGTLRAQTDRRLVADVPFVLDFSVDNNLDVSLIAELFGGGIRFLETVQQTTLSYQDFSPADFIDLKNGAVLPAQINLTLEFERDEKTGLTGVDPDGSFQLGKTRFTELAIQNRESKKSILTATGEVAGNTVEAQIEIAGPSSPWWTIRLQCDELTETDELWAQTLYGESFDSLTTEQQISVRATAPRPKVVADKETPAEEIPAEADDASVSESAKDPAASEPAADQPELSK